MTQSPDATCTVCGKQFVRRNTLARVCSPRCAIRSVKTQKAVERADFKRRKDQAKPRSKWLQEAQTAFNAWIRARDAGLGCISCGTHMGKANAGHYLSTAARPELRFDPLNVHLQCERCNTYLRGNLIQYRGTLIQRIGLAALESLEGPHSPKKYTVEDLRAIRDDYRSRLKEICD